MFIQEDNCCFTNNNLTWVEFNKTTIKNRNIWNPNNNEYFDDELLMYSKQFKTFCLDFEFFKNDVKWKQHTAYFTKLREEDCEDKILYFLCKRVTLGEEEIFLKYFSKA